MIRKGLISLALWIFFMVLVGCEQPIEREQRVYAVDPRFAEFYKARGGESVLGELISPAYQEGDLTLQFTVSVLMIFDPNEVGDDRIRLAPLGRELKVAQPFNPEGADGFQIHAGFLPLLRQIGGLGISGHPITPVMPDPVNRRIVQYFENIGVYQSEADLDDTSHLLAYGAWKCATACSFAVPEDALVLLPYVPPEEEAERLPYNLTGLSLTGKFISNEGFEVQIYEYVATFSDPNSPGGLAFLPLPALLGINPDPPVQPDTDIGKFIPTENGLGYYVPDHIDNFITQNSGYGLTGNPITSYQKISDELYRQCFETICVDFRPSEASGLQIRPMALGRRYKQESYDQVIIEQAELAQPEPVVENIPETTDPIAQEVTITAWESAPVISSSDIQVIWVMVSEDGDPIPDFALSLSLTKPDGSQQTKYFPTTDQSGKSFINIEPQNAANGTLIEYRVCPQDMLNDATCIIDDYMIWVE